MNLAKRQNIADELNKIPMIFLTKYPVALTRELKTSMNDKEYKKYKSGILDLQIVVKQLEVEKKLFWDSWSLKWVTQ